MALFTDKFLRDLSGGLEEKTGIGDKLAAGAEYAVDNPFTRFITSGLGRKAEEYGDRIEGPQTGEGLFEGAIDVGRKALADTMFRPVQHGIEGVGGAVGGTAAALDQLYNAPDNDLAAKWEGIKAGAGQGAETAKDAVEIVDVAGVGAGLGANMLVKGAKLATSTAQAAKLLRGARIAETADTALNIGDALHGIKTLGEDEPGKSFEGLMRIAGSAVGLGFNAKGFKELGVADTGLKPYQKFDAAVNEKPFEILDAAGNVVSKSPEFPAHGSFKKIDPLAPDQKVIIDPSNQAAMTPEQQRLDHLNQLRQAPTDEDLDRQLARTALLRDRDKGLEPGTTPTTRVIGTLTTASGHEIKMTSQKVKPDTPEARTSARIESAFQQDEDVASTFGYLTDLADSNGEQIAVRMAADTGRAPEEVLPHIGRMGFIELSAGKSSDTLGEITAGGWTLRPESLLEGNEGKRVRNALRWGNRYAVNPRNVASMAKNAFNAVIGRSAIQGGQAQMDELMEVIQAPHLKKYVSDLWGGGIRNPALDTELENVLFVEQLHYTAQHEGLGHAFPGSQHKKNFYFSGAPTTLTKSAPDGDLFDHLHDSIIAARRDPELNRELNIVVTSRPHLAVDGVIDRMRRASLGEIDATDVVAAKSRNMKLRTDRAQTVGPRKGDADQELPDVLDMQIEQGARIERLGPDLEKSEYDRLVEGLEMQRRWLPERNIHNRQLHNAQAEALRKVGREVEGKNLTLHERNRLEADAMRIVAVGQPRRATPFTQDELTGMTRRIEGMDIGDAIVERNIKEALEKFHLGDQLVANEIQLLEKYLLAPTQSPTVPFWRLITNAGYKTVGAMRAIRSSWDFSGAGRQGLYTLLANPKEAAKAWQDQMKAFAMGTKEEFDIYMRKLEDPRYNQYADLQKETGLHISHEYNPKEGSAFDLNAEEAFSQTELIDDVVNAKIPGLSNAANVVKRSERAYITFLNKMRVELYNKHASKMLRPAEEGGLGLSVVKDRQAFKDLAYMVNTLTGRGELKIGHISPESFIGKKMSLTETASLGQGTSEAAHKLLSTVFFAPRFAMSRAQLLMDTVGAVAGGTLHPAVMKAYMQNVVPTIALQIGTLSALAAMGVGKLTWDTRKSDFGVLKIGNTRYDPWGGLRPWVKLMVQLEQDEYFSSTGNYYHEDDFGATSKRERIGRFLSTKMSPAAALVMEILTGEDAVGKKRGAFKAAAINMTPMIMENLYEIMEEDSAEQAALSLPYIAVGGGTTTYNPYKRD